MSIEQDSAWVAGGKNLAEKAIAALDLGDDATGLVERIVALPPLEHSDVSAGLYAVDLLLYDEVGEHLDAALALLDRLPDPAALELGRAIASLTDDPIPAADLRRIAAAVDVDTKSDAPFSGIPDVVPTVLTLLGAVLQLRG